MPRLLPFALCVFAAGPALAGEPDGDPPTHLAARIDARLAEAFRAGGLTPAPEAPDAEFLRRVYLDMVGRIPSVAEARAFLDDPAVDRRDRLVERLLAGPRYAAHAAQVWRAFLVPQATANLQTQYLGVGVEAWVREQLRAGHTDDRIVRDLLTARLDYLDWTPERRARPAAGLSPVGYYQANDLKPETVAAAVGRTFLGLRLECAQCHDHPFDKWTRKQAWETAAFFAGVAPLEPVVEPAAGLARRRELTIADTKTRVSARFLDGAEPDWKASPDPRQAFAAWLTRPDNPYFARVLANRLWANFFGVGLVDPVDDWGPHNLPSHPELLDELAAAYAAGGFDPKVLIRAITRSAAYRRTSRQTHPSQADPRAFARMNVKGLSAEQLFDSLAQATGYRDPVPLAARSAYGWPATSPRGQFLAKFGGGSGRTDMQVSILQALSLMNGDWITRQTDPAHGEMVRAVADAPFLSDERRIETLFLASLSRRPTAAELARYLAHLKAADDPKRALADVLWALVNSQEFLVNR
jgi:hypothetical protein